MSIAIGLVDNIKSMKAEACLSVHASCEYNILSLLGKEPPKA
jgi:hypothetical protein